MADPLDSGAEPGPLAETTASLVRVYCGEYVSTGFHLGGGWFALPLHAVLDGPDQIELEGRTWSLPAHENWSGLIRVGGEGVSGDPSFYDLALVNLSRGSELYSYGRRSTEPSVSLKHRIAEGNWSDLLETSSSGVVEVLVLDEDNVSRAISVAVYATDDGSVRDLLSPDDPGLAEIVNCAPPGEAVFAVTATEGDVFEPGQSGSPLIVDGQVVGALVWRSESRPHIGLATRVSRSDIYPFVAGVELNVGQARYEEARADMNGLDGATISQLLGLQPLADFGGGTSGYFGLWAGPDNTLFQGVNFAQLEHDSAAVAAMLGLRGEFGLIGKRKGVN